MSERQNMTHMHKHTQTHTQQGACVNWIRYMAAGPLSGSVGFRDSTYWFQALCLCCHQ